MFFISFTSVCKQKFRREEIENGVAEAVWSRLMWQLFVKKGVVEAFLGCVANIPMWSAEKIFKSVSIDVQKCSFFFVLYQGTR